MYSVLLLSQSQLGLRQTVICQTSDVVRMFTRVGMSRGLGSTWVELSDTLNIPTGTEQEPLVATPIGMSMTPAQVRDVNFVGRTPNNILQAILKRVPSNPTPQGSTLLDGYALVMEQLDRTNSNSLLRFAVAQLVPATSNTVVVEQPVSVSAPVDIVRDAEPEPQPEPPSQPTQTMTAHTNEPPTERELAVLSVPAPFEYVERKFDGISETEMYDKATANQWNVLLKGDAGTGKSSSARNLAARRQVPFVVVECTQQIDNTVTHGRFVPGPDGKTLKWVYSQLATAIQQPSVILLNEFTRMNPKSSGLFLRLLEERELAIENFNEVIKVHPDCQIIGDANMGSMYSGTTRADAAFTDRFLLKLTFEYDSDLEKKFLPYPALLNFATQVRTAASLGQLDFTVPLSTRLLKAFAQQVKVFSYDFAKARLLDTFPADSGERSAIKTRLEADEPAIKEEFGV